MLKIEIKMEPWGDNQVTNFNPESDDFILYAFYDDIKIAHLSCYHESGRLYSFEVEVNEDFRRKGVATQLYDYASQISGKSINSHKDNPHNHESDISSDAEAFWSNRKR